MNTLANSVFWLQYRCCLVFQLQLGNIDLLC